MRPCREVETPRGILEQGPALIVCRTGCIKRRAFEAGIAIARTGKLLLACRDYTHHDSITALVFVVPVPQY